MVLFIITNLLFSREKLALMFRICLSISNAWHDAEMEGSSQWAYMIVYASLNISPFFQSSGLHGNFSKMGILVIKTIENKDLST